MSKTLTEARLREVLDYRFGGLLEAGSHKLDGQACINEDANFARALPDEVTGEAIRDYDFNLTDWHDGPGNAWDLRPLNDIDVDPVARTEVMIPLYVLYQHAKLWPEDKQRRVTERIVIGTAREVLPLLPQLPDGIRERCRAVLTLDDAESAASAAAWAAWAAERAAMAAGGEKVLRTTGRVWTEALAAENEEESSG